MRRAPKSSEDARRVARALRQHLGSLRELGVDRLPRSPSRPPSPPDRRPPAAAAQPVDTAPAAGSPPPDRQAWLADLVARASACRRCGLHKTRTHLVLGDGTPHAELVFVGEAPGQEEDRQGKPFVGDAGQQLNKMIAAMGLRREDVYICNVLKDRPPGNRTPEPEEMTACFPFLEEQLLTIRPRVICALGAVAAKALLGPNVSISRVRGEVHDWRGIPLVPTFHPAYLLRNPDAKRPVWKDLQVVMKLLAQPA